jgi:integrase
VPDRSEALAVIAGARRQRKEQPVRKAALSAADVRRICVRLCKLGTAGAARDRALLTLGFASALRRSNLVRLDLADVRFVPRKGVVVAVQSSKTDQEGRGRLIGVYAGVREETCPVLALRAWLSVRGDVPGPLFCRVRAGDVATLERLGGEAVNRLVQGWVSMIGLDGRLYGGHSLRAGFVTAAHNEHADTLAIMAVTGHRSVEMVRKYLRNADPFAASNPLARAL